MGSRVLFSVLLAAIAAAFSKPILVRTEAAFDHNAGVEFPDLAFHQNSAHEGVGSLRALRQSRDGGIRYPLPGAGRQAAYPFASQRDPSKSEGQPKESFQFAWKGAGCRMTVPIDEDQTTGVLSGKLTSPAPGKVVQIAADEAPPPSGSMELSFPRACPSDFRELVVLLNNARFTADGETVGIMHPMMNAGVEGQNITDLNLAIKELKVAFETSMPLRVLNGKFGVAFKIRLLSGKLTAKNKTVEESVSLKGLSTHGAGSGLLFEKGQNSFLSVPRLTYSFDTGQLRGNPFPFRTILTLTSNITAKFDFDAVFLSPAAEQGQDFPLLADPSSPQQSVQGGVLPPRGTSTGSAPGQSSTILPEDALGIFPMPQSGNISRNANPITLGSSPDNATMHAIIEQWAVDIPEKELTLVSFIVSSPLVIFLLLSVGFLANALSYIGKLPSSAESLSKLGTDSEFSSDDEFDEAGGKGVMWTSRDFRGTDSAKSVEQMTNTMPSVEENEKTESTAWIDTQPDGSHPLGLTGDIEAGPPQCRITFEDMFCAVPVSCFAGLKWRRKQDPEWDLLDQLSEVDYGGKKYRAILHAVSGEIYSGEVSAVLGPRGSGKTTFLRLLSGRLNDFERGAVVRGFVHVDSTDSGRKTDFSVAYLPPDSPLHGTLTVKEVLMNELPLAEGSEGTGRTPIKQLTKRVRDAVNKMGLSSLLDRRIGGRNALTLPEKRRVLIARELVKNPDVLVLDNPVLGLDSHDAMDIIWGCRGIAESGKFVVVSMAQPSNDVFDLLDRLVLLSCGRPIYMGPIEQVQDFFGRLGCPCPPDMAIAQHILRSVAKPSTIMEILTAIQKIFSMENCDSLMSIMMEEVEGGEKKTGPHSQLLKNNLHQSDPWEIWSTVQSTFEGASLGSITSMKDTRTDLNSPSPECLDTHDAGTANGQTKTDPRDGSKRSELYASSPTLEKEEQNSVSEGHKSCLNTASAGDGGGRNTPPLSTAQKAKLARNRSSNTWTCSDFENPQNSGIPKPPLKSAPKKESLPALPNQDRTSNKSIGGASEMMTFRSIPETEVMDMGPSVYSHKIQVEEHYVTDDEQLPRQRKPPSNYGSMDSWMQFDVTYRGQGPSLVMGDGHGSERNRSVMSIWSASDTTEINPLGYGIKPGQNGFQRGGRNREAVSLVDSEFSDLMSTRSGVAHILRKNMNPFDSESDSEPEVKSDAEMSRHHKSQSAGQFESLYANPHSGLFYGAGDPQKKHPAVGGGKQSRHGHARNISGNPFVGAPEVYSSDISGDVGGGQHAVPNLDLRKIVGGSKSGMVNAHGAAHAKRRQLNMALDKLGRSNSFDGNRTPSPTDWQAFGHAIDQGPSPSPVLDLTPGRAAGESRMSMSDLNTPVSTARLAAIGTGDHGGTDSSMFGSSWPSAIFADSQTESLNPSTEDQQQHPVPKRCLIPLPNGRACKEADVVGNSQGGVGRLAKKSVDLPSGESIQSVKSESRFSINVLDSGIGNTPKEGSNANGGVPRLNLASLPARNGAADLSARLRDGAARRARAESCTDLLTPADLAHRSGAGTARSTLSGVVPALRRKNASMHSIPFKLPPEKKTPRETPEPPEKPTGTGLKKYGYFTPSRKNLHKPSVDFSEGTPEKIGSLETARSMAAYMSPPGRRSPTEPSEVSVDPLCKEEIEYENELDGRRGHVPWLHEMGVLFLTTLKNICRSKKLLILHVALAIGLGVAVGMVFFDLSHSENGSRRRIAAIYASLCIVTLATVFTLRKMENDKRIALTDMRLSRYAPFSYAILHTVLETMILRFVSVCLFSSIFLPLTGMEASAERVVVFISSLTVFWASLATTIFCFMIFMPFKVGFYFMVTELSLHGPIMCGYLIPRFNLPGLMYYVPWISPFANAFEMMVSTEFSGHTGSVIIEREEHVTPSNETFTNTWHLEKTRGLDAGKFLYNAIYLAGIFGLQVGVLVLVLTIKKARGFAEVKAVSQRDFVCKNNSEIRDDTRNPLQGRESRKRLVSHPVDSSTAV